MYIYLYKKKDSKGSLTIRLRKRRKAIPRVLLLPSPCCFGSVERRFESLLWVFWPVAPIGEWLLRFQPLDQPGLRFTHVLL